MASVLLNRGLNYDDAHDLMENPVALIEDPTTMYGCSDAAKAIVDGIRNKAVFFVYADYDVDGMTSGTLLDNFFKNAGADCSVRFPERVDGYGITMEYANYVIESEVAPKIVITVDNGINGPTSNDAIAALRKADIEVIILDHHERGSELPNAVICDPWADPELNENTQGLHLCGCAVAWKTCIIAEAMLGRELKTEDMLPLVALGTVADVMPMTLENRAMVAIGLNMINSGRGYCKGVKKLMQANNITHLTAKDIGWTIGPHLNACSRMGDTRTGADVVLLDSPDIDKVLRYNKERKSLTDEAVKDAREEIGDICSLPVITFDASAYPKAHGIAGIIAGKLAETYGRPAVVYTKEQGSDECQGSCRSVPGISIKDIINNSAYFGHTVGASGHAEACGAILLKSKLSQFERDAAKYIIEHSVPADETVEPTLNVDAELDFGELCPGLVKEFNLVPFGGKGDEPLLCTEEVIVEPLTPFKNKDHLVLKMMDSKGKTAYALKWYGMAEYMELGQPEKMRIAGSPAPAKYAARSLGIGYSDAIIDLKYMQSIA